MPAREVLETASALVTGDRARAHGFRHAVELK